MTDDDLSEAEARTVAALAGLLALAAALWLVGRGAGWLVAQGLRLLGL